ncbi:MAG: GNAT family N-acetyltransferase [Actinomycetota bacterium]|nr:GNAT family N-acetyltransferase [Actinomycetota bacterium]
MSRPEPIPRLEPFSGKKAEELEEFLAEISGELSLRRGGTQLLGELGHPAELAKKISESSEDSFALTVTLNSTLSGLIWAKIVSNEFGDRVCLVPVFAVLNDARRHGVGNELFSALETWVASRNVTAIEFTALPGDRHTKNFCESNGLVARSLKMYKALGPS